MFILAENKQPFQLNSPLTNKYGLQYFQWPAGGNMALPSGLEASIVSNQTKILHYWSYTPVILYLSHVIL